MQVVLSPIYLLGAFASGHRPDASWILPFAAVHMGLYGGATAFNSFYDRDRAPIAFQKHPREVTRGEMRAAVLLQVAAVLTLFTIRVPAGAIALVMFVMGIAYSHPGPRWKRSAVRSLAAVALGQGAGAFCLGFFAAGGGSGASEGLDGRHGLVAAAGVAVLTAGLYPVTQVYQIEEDRRRGDSTLPTRFGWRRSLAFAVIAAAAGSWMLASALRSELSRAWGLALVVAPLAFAAILATWARRFETQDVGRRHDWAMGIVSIAAAFFLALGYCGLGR